MGTERQPGDHGSDVASPVRTALSGPERKDRQAVAIGRDGGGRPFEVLFGLEAEAIGEPADHVAALAECATEHIPLAIHAIDKRFPRHLESMAIEQDA